MIPKIAALIFELNSDALPLACINLPFSFAIGVSGLHRFNEVTQFTRHHSEEEYYALFVDRFMTQSSKINWIAVGGSIIEFRVTLRNLDWG